MTLQITCIRIKHDTWPEIYMILIYIPFENVHFHIFEVACNEVKSNKCLDMLISI